MVMSEQPVFADSPEASVLPTEGIWLNEDEECKFDPGPPEINWPRCAMWVVVRNDGRELHLKDGKGQSERFGAFFVAGSPIIIELAWVDTAKEPAKAIYGYFGLEPQLAAGAGQFARTSLWPVECGIQDTQSSDVRPFAGITAECRPTSTDAVRAAATSSRRPGQVKIWRWLRAERR